MRPKFKEKIQNVRLTEHVIIDEAELRKSGFDLGKLGNGGIVNGIQFVS